MWQIGVDVGGTFTDVFACDEATGRIVSHKTPSTPRDPSLAIAEALACLQDRFGADTKHIDQFCHGTTVATNALIERSGGKIALITTKGFRDLLTIGRQVRPLIYDLQADYPEPLIPIDLRFEVEERIGSKGEVLTGLTEDEINRVVAQVLACAPDGVSICFLFAFLNPEHERKLREALAAKAPDLFISTSHEVQPVFREFERFSTTVLNTYLQPVMSRYIHSVEDIVHRTSASADIGINQSSGGLMAVGEAARFPVRTALSGPAAGVVGAVEAASRSGRELIVTLDVGGTSTDVCLVREASVPLSFARLVAGFPIRLPSVDVNAVGAGGGSLIEIGPDGLMTVGPQSAGADPGAACYGKGGRLPTVTDASLVLGRLPVRIAGGDMVLDAGLSRAALAPLAESFGISIEQAAIGALRIVASNMVRAIRTVSVERGHDPRKAVLVPYGGAGGLHAIEVAEALGLTEILVPPDPGILCARGLMVADRTETFIATRRMALGSGVVELRRLLDRLNQEARGWLDRQRSPGLAQCSLDLRFIGQNYELTVDVPAAFDWTARDINALKARFWLEHERAYGHVDQTMPVEVVNVRVTAQVPAQPLAGPPQAANRPVETAWPTRNVWFEGPEPVLARIVERTAMPLDRSIAGPAVIEQSDATTLVWPAWSAAQDDTGNLMLEKDT